MSVNDPRTHCKVFLLPTAGRGASDPTQLAARRQGFKRHILFCGFAFYSKPIMLIRARAAADVFPPLRRMTPRMAHSASLVPFLFTRCGFFAFAFWIRKS